MVFLNKNKITEILNWDEPDFGKKTVYSIQHNVLRIIRQKSQLYIFWVQARG